MPGCPRAVAFGPLRAIGLGCGGRGLWWPCGPVSGGLSVNPPAHVCGQTWWGGLIVGRACARQACYVDLCLLDLLPHCSPCRLPSAVRHTCRLGGGASAGARVGPTSLCWGGGGCQAGTPIGPLAAQVLSLCLRPPQVVAAGGAGPRGLQRIPGTGPLCTRRLGQEEMKSRL